MERFGWTLTEVRDQPFLSLLEILQDDNKQASQTKKEEEVITGTDLARLFSG